MSIKFKNAGFKNTEEDIKQALKRMIDGEVFYLEGKIIQFQIKWLKNASYCFMVDDVVRLDNAELNRIEEWKVKVKVDWRENIGEGVWCWVADAKDFVSPHAELIKRYEGEDTEYPYVDAYGTGWKHAKPMTREEVENYIWGD